MDEPVNRALIDKWKTADALYATPTGSNDDWYEIREVTANLHDCLFT